MRNKLVLLFTVAFATIAFTACTNESEAPLIKEVVYNGEQVELSKLLDSNSKYLYMDINDDLEEDLVVSTETALYVIEMSINEVVYEGSAYDVPVSGDINGILYKRDGAAPRHIDYQFYSFNSKFEQYDPITFSWYDGNENDEIDAEDVFLDSSDSEISMNEWEQQYSKYIDLLGQEITWKEIM